MDRREQVGRRVGRSLLGLLVVVMIGTLGYVVIEDWPLLDAIYMTVTTVATVGYGEIRPLSTAGRVFTLGLIAVGVAGLWYVLSMLVGLMVEGQVTQRWERRRMERRIEGMRDHLIVCGYGRVGRQIVQELRRERRPVVVLDVNPPSLEEAAREGLLVVHGNATEDETLRRAGIERARGLITAVANDADNVFVTLSARALRPDLPIVARANFDDAVPKLRRAGATQVVSPYAMAGLQMARLVVRPSTVDFVETLLRGTDGDLLLEDLRVAAGSLLVDLPVAEVRRRFADALLLAVQRDGRLLAPPPAELALRAGDVVAFVGRGEQLRALERASQDATA